MQRIRQMGLVIKSAVWVVILVVPHNDGRRSRPGPPDRAANKPEPPDTP